MEGRYQEEEFEDKTGGGTRAEQKAYGGDGVKRQGCRFIFFVPGILQVSTAASVVFLGAQRQKTTRLRVYDS